MDIIIGFIIVGAIFLILGIIFAFAGLLGSYKTQMFVRRNEYLLPVFLSEFVVCSFVIPVAYIIITNF